MCHPPTERRKEEAGRASGSGTEADGEEGQNDDASGELKVNPIKINLKMLKVTEANGKLEDEPADSLGGSVQSGASTNLAAMPGGKAAVLRGKKTAEQLHLLKRVYARTQWPSAAQYDELISGTGLPRPDVVRWFGDCRYMQKNSQLKWLEAYQNTALDEDLHQDNERFLQAHLDSRGGQEESQLQELAKVTGLTTDLVRYWFATRAAAARPEQVSALKPAAGAAVAEPPPPPGSSPVEPHPRGSNEKIEQSLCGQAGKGDTHNTTQGAD